MCVQAQFNDATQLIDIFAGDQKVASFQKNILAIENVSDFIPINMVGGTKCFVAKAAFCERFSIGLSDPVLEQIITEALSPESFISDYQRKKEIALASLNADSKPHEIYTIVQEFPHDLDVVLKAVRLNGEAICYAGEEYKSHPMIIVEAIKNAASAWIYVHDQPLINRDFILRLVTLNGELISYLDPEHKDDKELVLAAMDHNVDAFCCASARLRTDREVVLKAAEKKGSLLIYAESSFLENRINLEDAWLLNPTGVQDYFDERHKSQEEQIRIVLSAIRKKNAEIIDDFIFDDPGRFDILTSLKWLAPNWLAKYNNGPIRSFLTSTLFTILKSDRLDFFLEQAAKVIDSTTHNERILGIIGLFSMDIDDETLGRLCDFITKKKSVFKDGSKLQIILQFLQQLPSKELPKRKVTEILYNCFIDDLKDEGVKRMRLMTAILKAEPRAVMSLSDYSSEKLVLLLLEKLKESGIIDATIDESEEKFYKKFVETGLYAPFFAYLGLHLSDPEMFEPLKTFVRSILEDNFEALRNEHNSHAEYLTVDQKRIWEGNLEEDVDVILEEPQVGFKGF